MIADQYAIAQLVAGNLGDGAQALLMFGVPEQAEMLSRDLIRPEASSLIGACRSKSPHPCAILSCRRCRADRPAVGPHDRLLAEPGQQRDPPVALAAFTAAAIAKAPAMATGVASWKLAKGLYITPFLSSNWPEMSRIFAVGRVGIYAISAALQGCMEHPFGTILRVLSLVTGVACFWPGMLFLNIAGAIGMFGLLLINLKVTPRPAARAT